MALFLLLASMLVANAFALCPDGYFFYGPESTCLKSHDEKKSFAAARQTCQSEGGDLVQVYDVPKQRFITENVHGQWYWMGVEDKAGDRVFSYVDGTPLGSYHPWRAGEPNNSGNSEYCVLVVGRGSDQTGEWNDGNCRDALTFVCEVRVCPKNYKIYEPDNLCIGFHTDRKNFNDARQTCQAEGGDIVQVKDPRKGRFILAMKPDWHWIGIVDSNKDRTFTNIDGSQLGWFQPWANGEPNNWRDREDCVMVIGRNHHFWGHWNDAYCLEEAAYVCEKSRSCKL